MQIILAFLCKFFSFIYSQGTFIMYGVIWSLHWIVSWFASEVCANLDLTAIPILPPSWVTLFTLPSLIWNGEISHCHASVWVGKLTSVEKKKGEDEQENERMIKQRNKRERSKKSMGKVKALNPSAIPLRSSHPFRWTQSTFHGSWNTTEKAFGKLEGSFF